MSNVIPFRRRAVLSEQARPVGQVKIAGAPLRPHATRRPSLVAVWRVNAAGRLECRWSCDGSASLDEAGSRRGRKGQAA